MKQRPISASIGHTPVMLKEVLEYLAPQDDAVYVDATFGAGGYSEAILNAANCSVYGLDRDGDVEPYANALKLKYGSRFTFIRSAFAELGKVAENHKLKKLDGVVFDVGVSSMQLGLADRGFSFARNGALDMRMDDRSDFTASDLINHYSERDLANIIFNYGGERKSYKIAEAIVSKRKVQAIETTTELADIITRAVGRYHDTIHPATRTFQAIRIAVNDEMQQLNKALEEAHRLLNFGGKIVVVTFHSLEDKIVKDCFTQLCGKRIHQNRYAPKSEPNAESEAKFALVLKGVAQPTRQEVKNNPKARSAKLRAIERVA